MSTFAIIPEVVGAFKISYGTLSGNVKNDTVNVSRSIRVFKNNDLEPTYFAVSDASTGNFSVDVEAGTNDRFTIMAVGISGENTDIISKVTAIL